MYEEYFGLAEAPFSIAPNPQYLYMSTRHREALAHLLYGIHGNGGIILLTGEVGTGKTTVSRCLLEQLPENVDTAFILNPKLNPDELLASICDDLLIDYPAAASTRVLVDRLNAYLVNTVNNDRQSLLIIDEAQNLSVEVLEQLRLLTNLETNERKLLQIILIGQPELLEKLSQQALRQLCQRITARFHLEALNRLEVAEYIAHRLSIAGARANFFSASAMRHVFQLSAGIPRVINLVCDRALLGTFAENKAIVTPRIVSKAAAEILSINKTVRNWRPTAALAASIVIILAIFWSRAPTTSPIVVENAEVSPPASVINVTPFLRPPPQESWFTPLSEVVGHDKQRDAFDDLFALWGLFLEDQTTDPCQAGQSIGLGCLQEKGGLRGIIKLNRPVMVQLHGSGHWLTISSTSENAVTLIARDREFEVSRASLEQKFDGTYTLLWRMPPGYKTPISLGDVGADVDWLVNQLAVLEPDRPNQTTGYTFDDNILEQVKRFQRNTDLPASGVVDPRVWIHINSVEGINIPFLSIPDQGKG